MWELNRRLEAYLARVKALEEQNELLSAELGGLRAQSGDASWRARADDELAALRALVDQRWREKHAAEVARDNLVEEVEGVAGRYQRQRLARERTAEEVARHRRAVEAEKCAQAWLTTQAAELERELEALRAAHEEERAGLNAQAACVPRGPAAPRGGPAPAPEVEDLARRLSQAWRGAVLGYQERVAHMETSLGQALERLGRAVQGAREGRLELQQLQAERGGLQERRAALEQRLEGRWQERLRATDKFQLAVEALEQEKQGLQSQIAQVLEGRQQLAHLKMSLSLEVATYRTLLEAENSRLQTAGSGSKAPLSFQDPKLELNFPGIPEGRHLGPLLSVMSPTPLSSPLPDSLETPVPAFLKSQEFLQARTPTLASTPILPTLQAPCPNTDAEIRAQNDPLSLLQPQAGRQQAPEATWAEAKVAIPARVLPEPEEPGGKQQEVSTGQSPEDHASLAPPLSLDHPSLEARDGEPSGSRGSSRFQEEGEGQIWGLAEKETFIEVKMVNSLQQETEQKEGAPDMNEVQNTQGPLEKETLKSVEEEIQEPLVSLEKQSHESLRSLEKETQESLKSLEEKNLGTPESLEKETQKLMTSLEGSLETFLCPGKESQELVKSLEEESFESLKNLEKENQEPLWSLEDKNQETLRLPEKEKQESLRSPKDENHETLKPLEQEVQEPLRPLEEDQETLRSLGKENKESLMSSGDENHETLSPLEKENQDSLRSLEEEGEEAIGPLEKEVQEPLRYLEEVQETLRPLEKETQQPLRSLGDQMTLGPLEKVKPETLMSLEKDQEVFRPLEKENQDLRSLKEENVEVVRSSETENLEPLKSAGEDLEILKSLEMQEPLWPLEDMNQGTVNALEKQNQEALRSLGEWNLENLRSTEEGDKENQRYLEEEENLEEGEKQELLGSLEEEGQGWPLSANMRRQEDAVGHQELDEEMPPGRAGVESEDEAGLDLRDQDGFTGKEKSVEQGELRVTGTGEAWSTAEGHPGSPEPKEQGVPLEGTSREGGTEGLQGPEGQPEHVGAPGLPAPQGTSEVIQRMLEGEDEAPGGTQVSSEATLGLETDVGESTAGTEQGTEQGTTQEAAGLEDPGHVATEEAMEPPPGQEGLETKRVQSLGEPRKELEEAAALGPELSTPPGGSRDPGEPAQHWEVPAPEAPWEADGFPTLSHDGRDIPQPRPLVPEEAAEDARLVPGSPEPWLPTPIPGDAPGHLAEGCQEASWGLQGSAEALGRVEGEQEELSSGEVPEGLQDEGEESREESEADELGETLPDSTPLGLYLRSPASPSWGLAAEQRPPPQGDAGREGWGPAVLAPEGPGSQLSEEEEDGDERGQDSDLSEEFEDLGTEASLLPRVPREVVEPTAWEQDGESDGFADEEESGEEEERAPGVGRWGPGSSAGSFPAPSGPQTETLPESETVPVSVPWDDSLRGTVAHAPLTALETEARRSTESSGSEGEPDPAPSEREDRVPGPLDTPSGVEDTGLGLGDTPDVNGQGPSLKEELEHVNGGVVNGLEQTEGGGQGELGAPEGDRGSPLEEEEGGALKTPWAGAVHLGPSQFLKFTPREGEGDSWTSGED